MESSEGFRIIKEPWKLEVDEVLEEINVDPERGLSRKDVSIKRKKYGRNILKEKETKSAWLILLDQFKSLIIILLAAASALSFALGEIVDGSAISVAILLNGFIGFFIELKAVRAMEALRKISKVTAAVIREGKTASVSSVELVPGDIVAIESGDIVAADMRIIEASKLQVNESALTGESVPVAKDTAPLDADAQLADRKNMLFSGSSITRGSGFAVITATGMFTEIGKISEMTQEAESETTPLEKRLDKLGRKLVWITLAVTAAVTLAGILRGKETFLMFKSGVALAVAAVPEGLPIVATIALARGMIRMARRNALVNRLASVEILGATTDIFSDKTGTLTENRMTVKVIECSQGKIELEMINGGEELKFTKDAEEYRLEDVPIVKEIIKAGVLCNNAEIQEEAEDDEIGDPLEAALLRIGAGIGMRREELTGELPEAREEAFEPETKMMAAFHKEDGEYLVAVKGASEKVLENCSSILTGDGVEDFDDKARDEWKQKNERLAGEGLRILAIAEKKTNDKNEKPYKNMTFLGLTGLLDPPRADVKDTIKIIHKAGVRIKMITGDHPGTAQNIARAINLVENDDEEAITGKKLNELRKENTDSAKDKIFNSSIFARVTPEQKLDLISAHQEKGAIVAMTGDGVNDAPALKKADIGVAMGKRGTQVAQDASDMILKDDRLRTIETAIEQGRIIFRNIRKFVIFLLSGNMAEIFAVGIASFLKTPLPLLPLQILFLNFVLDVFPALSLGVGDAGRRIMEDPPRDPKEPIITGFHWRLIFGYGTLIAATVLASFFTAYEYLDYDETQAVTVSFLTLAFARLWHVFNMRDFHTGLFDNEIIRNRWVWGAIAICIGLLSIVVYIPSAAEILKIQAPTGKDWLIVFSFSVIPFILGQIYIAIRGRKQ